MFHHRYANTVLELLPLHDELANPVWAASQDMQNETASGSSYISDIESNDNSCPLNDQDLLLDSDKGKGKLPAAFPMDQYSPLQPPSLPLPDILLAGVTRPISNHPILDEDDFTGERCPFCDEQMPIVPSARLAAMMAELEAVSTLQPTISNPNHRHIDNWEVFWPACEQHRFEVEEEPIARACGWPAFVDFTQIWSRILHLRRHLYSIVESPTSSEFFKDVMKLYNASSSSNINSLEGQMRLFDGQSAG